jgi:NAD(P)H-hydrate epimerase
VFVATPASVLPLVQATSTETVGVALPETSEGTVATDALDAVLELAAGAHAVAIGPGLTTDDRTQAFVRALVRASPAPVVLDADGLNAFAGRLDEVAERASEAVLTPHLGELGRLLGRRVGPADRLGAARELAARAGAVALVKGTRTVVADPQGDARVNPTGTPALATAGTGDVLTGVIGGLLARGIDPFSASWAAAYVHGLAGVLAGRDLGTGVVAGDVAERLPEAFAAVEAQA